ncbi:ATP-binding protein [Pseudoalteromonas simplex]|uniref:ATP-binding protein n=1 Tax=Pseudoalteromonas simplex TaxID=2783613 RepID=UPI0018886B87|nr:ATP-binding protein [Pseudoalteromonas sp. A520]
MKFMVPIIAGMFLSVPLQATAITATEFEKLRNQVRNTYANSRQLGLEEVNKILANSELNLEQKIIMTNYKAWVLSGNNKLDEAMITLVEFESMVAKSKDKSLMYGYYNISGNIYSHLGLYQEALNHYKQALPFAKMRNNNLVMQTENNIAVIYLKLHLYNNAAEIFKKFREYSKTNNHTFNESFTSNLLAKALLGLKKYDQALELLSNIYNFQKSNDFLSHQIVNLTTQGKIYNSQAQYKKAEIILKKALNLLNENNLQSDKLAVVLELAKTYKAQNKPALALAQIQSIDLKNKKISDYQLLLATQELSASLHLQQKNYHAAIDAYKQLYETQEKILRRQTSTNLAKALAELDITTKEAEIELLTKSNQVQASKNKANKVIFMAIAIALCSILIVLTLMTVRTKQQKNALSKTLTKLHNTQAQLIEIEKIASLTALVSGMAHQLNTPIGTIVTASSLIDDQLTLICQKFKSQELSSKHLHSFLNDTNDAKDLIQASIARLASIVEEFKALNVSIDLDKPLVQFNLKEEISRRVLPFSSYLGKCIKFDIQGDNVVITSYPAIIGDILKTLIINSCEHGFAIKLHGLIEIEIKAFPKHVEIIYQDNGVGIKETILHDIFTPFYTTNMGDKHLGLGLNVVFNAVKFNLKGEICAEPYEHGARFVISLPIDARLVDDTSY